MKDEKLDLVKEMEGTFAHWNDVYENGTFDPSWADGINLNLIRNHLLYYKKQMEEAYVGKELPSVYYRPIPDEVDNDYMAKETEILEKAMSLHETCSKMKEVQDLLSAEAYMSEKELNKLHIQIDINRIRGLEEAILEKDYVGMRCLSRDEDTRINEIKEAHERLMSREHQQDEQMNIFEMMM